MNEFLSHKIFGRIRGKVSITVLDGKVFGAFTSGFIKINVFAKKL